MKAMSPVASKHTVSPTNPPTKKICKDCIHFKATNFHGVQLGKCTLFGIQNLVDGTIEYKYANVAREFYCHGDNFELKQSFLNIFDIPFDVLDAREKERTYDK